jgi:hypothetical protein
MTPWWSFLGLKQKLGRFQFLLLLIALMSGVAYLGYFLGVAMDNWQQNKIAEQNTRLSSLYQELDNKIRQINYLSVELEVEQNANAQIKDELLELREESFALRRELNFYQKVLAPELVANGISVEQFQVEETNIPGRYKFQFALVQTDSRKRYAKGHIKLKLIATQEESMVNFDLAKLANFSKDDLKFSFHYFQYFEGEFELDPNVMVEELEVRVIQPKSKWQKYKSFVQRLAWPEFEAVSDD